MIVYGEKLFKGGVRSHSETREQKVRDIPSNVTKKKFLIRRTVLWKIIFPFFSEIASSNSEC